MPLRPFADAIAGIALRSHSMPEEIARQVVIDHEHLKLLSLGYMISAGISAFFSLMGLMYMVMGAFMSAMISQMPKTAGNGNQPPPAFIGWLFSGIGLAIFLLLMGIAALKLRAAFCIRQRRSRTFCMVVAALCCLGIPYGTLLGVLTFIIMGRDSVASQFKRAATT
jgi:hypothetical protein